MQLGNLLTDALIWAVAIVLAMATAGAIIVRSLFRRTVANVSATAAAIAAGDFAQRVKVSGRGDEFDQLAEVINDMLDRIGRLMDGVRQVSNAIAHDLAHADHPRPRPPGGSRPQRPESNADLHAAIDRATIDLDDIVTVFQALLRIAEIEAGSRRASFRRVDIVTALEGVADLYGAVAEEKGVDLTVSHPQQLEINGDAALIQQAVANLVDNAVKFSPEHGAGQTGGGAGRTPDPDHGHRPGTRHTGGRSVARHGTLLSRRYRARHAWLRSWPRSGAGGRILARRRVAAGGRAARIARGAGTGACRGHRLITSVSSQQHHSVRRFMVADRP